MSASDVAGLRIREARKAKGWLVRDLAGHCAKAGIPRITATIITNLETRRRASREITVDELLAIACVLDVPPLQLVSPLGADERLEITPGVKKDMLEASGWIADDASVLGPVRMARDGRPEFTEQLLRRRAHTSALTIVRQIREVAARIRRYPGGTEYDDRTVPILGERLMYLLESLAALEHEPPALPEVMEIFCDHGFPAPSPNGGRLRTARDTTMRVKDLWFDKGRRKTALHPDNGGTSRLSAGSLSGSGRTAGPRRGRSPSRTGLYRRNVSRRPASGGRGDRELRLSCSRWPAT